MNCVRRSHWINIDMPPFWNCINTGKIVNKDHAPKYLNDICLHHT